MYEVTVLSVATVLAGVLSFVVCYGAAAWARPTHSLMAPVFGMAMSCVGVAGVRLVLGYPPGLLSPVLLNSYLLATLFVGAAMGFLGWSIVERPRLYARFKRLG